MKKNFSKDLILRKSNVVIEFVIKLITLLGMLINLRIYPYFL